MAGLFQGSHGDAPAVRAECRSKPPGIRRDGKALLVCRQVPDLDRVVETRRSEAAAAGAEGHGVNLSAVAADRGQFLPVRCLQDLDTAIVAGRSHALTVGAESHPPDDAA